MPRSPASLSRSGRWWVVIIAAAIVLPIAWYLGSPLFLSKTVNDPFPLSAKATIPDGMTHQQVADRMAQAAKADVTMAEAMPFGGESAAVARRGTFVDGDRLHRGQGSATVYRVGQNLVLRLAPFKVTNGPNLYVYLAGHAAPRNSEELHTAGAFEVGRLRGNIGEQNYPLPPGLDLVKFKSVVIYCRMFHVVFSTASLASQ